MDLPEIVRSQRRRQRRRQGCLACSSGMATMGFTFTDGEAGNVPWACRKCNHRVNLDDSCRSDFGRS